MGERSRLAIVAALTGAILTMGVPSFPASAADDQVDFTGSGWGHGVGMSQWGAYGLATLGWAYDDILAHYYRGTSLQTLAPEPTIWVNLEEKFTSKTLTVLNVDPNVLGVPVQVKLDAQVVNAQPGATIALNSHGGSGCIANVTNPGGAVSTITDPAVCGIDLSWDGNVAGTPTTKILIHGCSNTDWNASGSPSVPCQYARGQMHLRSGTGGLYLSASMRMDDYVKGISEIPYTWSAAAQRAQVVAARSYAEYQRRVRSDLASSGCWCGVRDTTSDQRYVGWGHSNKTSWINATNDTADKVLTHAASSLGVIKAYYSSSTGGNTEHGHLVGFASSPVEWLTSVSDVWAVDGTVPNPNSAWTRSVGTTTVSQALGFDAVVSVRVTAVRPGSGSAAQVEFEGILNGLPVSVVKTSGWTRTTFGLKSEYFTVDYTAPPGSQLHPQGDEMLLYAANGTFRYHSLHPSGILGATINSGTNYTSGWKSIDAIDLDGDGQDEIMFYRADGLYRYYDIHSNGSIGSPIAAGDEYTTGWDSITAVDLDGDGQDEIMFYREDGLYRYYDIHSNGRIGSPITAGSSYTNGWDVVTAVDLDSDSRDEMFFYRGDGLYRFYDVFPNGSLSAPLKAGSNFSTGWSVITPINLDGS